MDVRWKMRPVPGGSTGPGSGNSSNLEIEKAIGWDGFKKNHENDGISDVYLAGNSISALGKHRRFCNNFGR